VGAPGLQSSVWQLPLYAAYPHVAGVNPGSSNFKRPSIQSLLTSALDLSHTHLGTFPSGYTSVRN
jgi:hypothetical protein